MSQTRHAPYGQIQDDIDRKLKAGYELEKRDLNAAACESYLSAYLRSKERDDDIRWRRAKRCAERVEPETAQRMMEDE